MTIPGVPHHVIHRGNNRRRLVSYATDYSLLLRLIGKASRKWACPLHAFALMSNHLHLIVTPPTEIALSKFVKGFAGPYALERNRQRDGSGKLFEQTFLSFPLPNPLAVGLATAYVDLNPVRGGLVANAAAHRWSSAALHLGDAPVASAESGLWRPSEWYAALGSHKRARAAAYADWLTTTGPPEYVGELVKIELLSSQHYSKRLTRPNQKRAS